MPTAPLQITTQRSEKSQVKSDSDVDRHFRTDHLLADLRGRTISGGFITGVSQMAVFALNFGSVAILAHLLTPQDFGLVAMVLTISGFLRVFHDAGLSTATVQREGVTHTQVSNLFWMNVGLGAFAALLLAVSAPFIAWFYREPRLVAITSVLCLSFLLTSSAVQHWAILKRQMRFKMMAAVQVVSVAVGVLVAVVMAWYKCRYWSLVGMQLTTPLVALVGVWFASQWRPQLPRRRSGTRPLLGFGANLSASSFLWSLARGSDNLLIGRFYGPAALGLYSRGAALLSRPVTQFMAPLEAVFVPTLSRLQAQPDRYRRVTLRIYDMIAVTSFPFSGLCLALAYPLTLVVLGAKWENAAPILASFSFVALYTPVASISSWLLISQGRGRDFLIQGMIGSAVIVISFLVALPFGPMAVAVSYSSFCLLVGLPVIYYVGGRTGPVSSKDLWGRFFTHLPLWAVVCGSTFFLHCLLPKFSPVLQLLICGSFGLSIGSGFIWVYPPARRAAYELLFALRNWMARSAR